MRFTRLSVPFICLLLGLGFANQSLGQRTLGVQWDVPQDHEIALQQLDTFHQLGIELLEVRKPLNDETWQLVDTLGFRVYGHLSIKFPLVKTFANPDSALLNNLRNSVNHYISRPSVEAIGVFKYGAVHESAFDTTLQNHLQKIRKSFGGQLYYTAVRPESTPVDRNFDFRFLEMNIGADQDYLIPQSLSAGLGGILYRPYTEINTYLAPFRTFVEKYKDKPIPIFVSSDWLLAMLDKYPDFAQTIQLYHSDSEFIFPVPKESISISSSHNLIVLLLVAIWCLLAVNYHMSPVYRKSALRYFVGHVFFVEDVMNRHIRSVGASFIILIQNMLLTGITIYCLSQVLFSFRGFEAILFHYPIVSIFPKPAVSLFLWACLLAGILTVISILWIKVSNKEVRSFRQVLNLYAWPLQINLILATAMVTLLMAGSYPKITLILAILFAAVHISAFVVTAIDTSKYLASQKALFLVGSVGIYLLLWIGLAYWLIDSDIPDVVQLALHL